VGLLVLVVLLLAIMPETLYLVGWSVNRYANTSPAWIDFPTIRKEPTERPDGEAPAGAEA
jgi:hypothetical protein